MYSSSSVISRATQSPLPLFIGILMLCIGFKVALIDLRAASAFPLNISVTFALGILLSKYRYQPGDQSVRILIAGIALMFGFYALANYPAYSLESNTRETYFEVARYLVCLFAIGAIWRPSLALAPILYTVWRKDVDIVNIGYKLSPTDYMPVVEVSFLLVIGLLLLNLAGRFFPETREHRQPLLTYLLLAAIGIHFGNYFHSGLAKLMLDGGPASWVFDNHTYYLINTAMELGTLPISQFPQLTQYVFDIFQQHYVVFNIITLAGQLACLPLITSIPRIIIITVFFDVMHVLIFLTTGIFFWKWIVLNMLIIAAVNAVDIKTLPHAARITGLFFTLFGILVFFTAKLAWYDTQTLRHVYVQATDNSGRVYSAPTNYFLNTSVTFAQGRLLPAYPGHFALTNAMGSTASYQAMQLLNKCTPLMYNTDQAMDYQQLTNLVRKNHAFVIGRETPVSRFDYDLFPHHIWSNPAMYSNFKQLPKNSIDHYNIVVDSKCLKLVDGIAMHALIRRSVSEDIDVHGG